MPNTTSAEKAHRQNLRHRKQNSARKSKLAKTIKAYSKLIIAQKREEAITKIPNVFQVVDKMTKIGLIKKNKANRLKSRLSKKLSLAKK